MLQGTIIRFLSWSFYAPHQHREDEDKGNNGENQSTYSPNGKGKPKFFPRTINEKRSQATHSGKNRKENRDDLVVVRLHKPMPIMIVLTHQVYTCIDGKSA